MGDVHTVRAVAQNDSQGITSVWVATNRNSAGKDEGTTASHVQNESPTERATGARHRDRVNVRKGVTGNYAVNPVQNFETIAAPD